MPLRVYCPDCAAPRTAPEVGSRVRCRVCDRVFRAGTRVEFRGRRDDPTRHERPDGSQPLLLILGGIALLLFGLAIGGGLVGWFLLTRPASCPPPDDEMIEMEDEGDGPPVIDPGPMNPGPPVEQDP